MNLLGGKNALSAVISSETEKPKKGFANFVSLKLFHKSVDSFLRVTKNTNITDLKLNDEPQLIIINAGRVSHTKIRFKFVFLSHDFQDDIRIKFALFPAKGPEYDWDFEPTAPDAYEISVNIFSCKGC